MISIVARSSLLIRNGVVGALVVAAVVLGTPSVARADDAAPDPDLQAAKAEFESAQTLFIKEQFDEAANHFLGAYARKPFPAFLFNAAVSYYPWKNWGIEAGYNLTKYDIKVSKESWNGEANYKFNGPVLSFVGSF